MTADDRGRAEGQCIDLGLGVDIDEAKVREAAKSGHRWRNPIWRTADGVVAEW